MRLGSCPCLDAYGRESSLVFTPYRPPRGGLKNMLSEKGVAAAAEEETRSTNGRARPGVLTVEGVGRELLEEVPRPGGAQGPVCAVVCLTCK